LLFTRNCEQIQKNEMGGAYITPEGEEKCTQYLVRKLRKETTWKKRPRGKYNIKM
jgi:hypothetical protein